MRVGGRTPLWSTTLPYSQLGSMAPVYDPITNTILVSDGWGTPYASIRLRKLDADTGQETASVRLHNVGRCVFFLDDKTLVTALDNRLVAFDRQTLTEVARWDRRIPRYTDFAV